MKHTLFTTLTLLATTLLTGTPGLGQDGSSVGFDSSSRQGQSGTGPSRLGPAELKFTLTARGQTLVQDPAGSGLVVREDPNGKEAEGTQFLPRTGLPNISMRQVNVLLPYQADFDGLRLRVVAEETEHVGFFDIAPVSMVTSSTEDDSGAFSLEEVPLDGVHLLEPDPGPRRQQLVGLKGHAGPLPLKPGHLSVDAGALGLRRLGSGGVAT